MTDATRTKERLSPKRKRMRRAVAMMQRYVATYSDQESYDTYADKTFINDMLYGIGYALDAHEYSGAAGFDAWKEKLREFLK